MAKKVDNLPSLKKVGMDFSSFSPSEVAQILNALLFSGGQSSFKYSTIMNNVKNQKQFISNLIKKSSLDSVQDYEDLKGFAEDMKDSIREKEIKEEEKRLKQIQKELDEKKVEQDELMKKINSLKEK